MLGLEDYSSSDEDPQSSRVLKGHGNIPSAQPDNSKKDHAPAASTNTRQNLSPHPPAATVEDDEPVPAGPVLGPTAQPPLPSSQIRNTSSHEDNTLEPQASTQTNDTNNINDNDLASSHPSSVPDSPRTMVQNLTLPTVPNTHIPASPSPPTSPRQQQALAATTTKLERFLALKSQKNEHLNAKLASSTALRNPAILQAHLLEFAGIGDQYVSTLPPGVAPTPKDGFPEWAYVEELGKSQQREAKRMERGRGEAVEFVSASSGGSNGGSKAGSNDGRSVTPGAKDKEDKVKKRSGFDVERRGVRDASSKKRSRSGSREGRQSPKKREHY